MTARLWAPTDRTPRRRQNNSTIQIDGQSHPTTYWNDSRSSHFRSVASAASKCIRGTLDRTSIL
jgi:hypothetical protein